MRTLNCRLLIAPCRLLNAKSASRKLWRKSAWRTACATIRHNSLADEPTGNLDSRNGEAVMDLLQSLHREGATICMVTHDARFAKHAERTIHLFDGKVVEETEAAQQAAEMA